ncbi:MULTISPECIES: hypothetical protein [Streptomyces]|uniref:Uncharacterized protein n=1 Tax=Streptomyces albus TaxID=1888 RepID=A0A6C1C743_9ACTN|nr:MULTISPECIES: hypothetical protein [Streptomyces]QID38713.1 hypothetical protein G3260_005412 [Streptomyces albus]TGG80480.1 hypothetical protein D8771_22070 [Streptomyces albus]UVN54281.1 hypothetical protein NR995_06830 [Streptomyces albus]GHJ25115.1 hypothetical protein TPA0909_67290 [Streptomyces albus]
MTDPEHYALAMGGGPAPGPAVPQEQPRPRAARTADEPGDDDSIRRVPYEPGPAALTRCGP